MSLIVYPADNEEGYCEYCGEISESDGLRHGLGVLSWINGANYAGEWVDDQPEGYGCEQYADGSVYGGQFQGSLRHGLGYFQTDTYKYSGHWKEGMRHGTAIETTCIDGEQHEMFSIYRNDELKKSYAKTAESSGTLELELQFLISITKKVLNSVNRLVAHVHRYEFQDDADRESNPLATTTDTGSVDSSSKNASSALPATQQDDAQQVPNTRNHESTAPLPQTKSPTRLELLTPATTEAEASLILHDNSQLENHSKSSEKVLSTREIHSTLMPIPAPSETNNTSQSFQQTIDAKNEDEVDIISDEMAKQDSMTEMPVKSEARIKSARRVLSANSNLKNQLAELVRQMVETKVNCTDSDPAQVLADKLVGMFSGESQMVAAQIQFAKQEVLQAVQSELRHMIADLQASSANSPPQVSTLRNTESKMVHIPSLSQNFNSIRHHDAANGNLKEAFYDDKTGDTYEGSFLNGRYHGFGKLVTKCGITYEGEFLNGLKDGYGTLSWPANESAFARYEGEFARGKKHGRGHETLGKGNRRTVFYKHGRLQNENQCRFPQVRLSTPQMTQPITSLKSRKGKKILPNDIQTSRILYAAARPSSPNKIVSLPTLQLTRELESFPKLGENSLVTKTRLFDGIIYVGEVENDIPHGLGVALFPQEPPEPEGRIEYAGEFRRGWRSGLGCMQWQDGTSFVGEWKKNKACGFGIESYPDGSSYQGTFLNDKRDGCGVYQYADGTRCISSWQHGRQGKDKQFLTHSQKVARLEAREGEQSFSREAGSNEQNPELSRYTSQTEEQILSQVIKITEKALKRTELARAVAAKWHENEERQGSPGKTGIHVLPE